MKSQLIEFFFHYSCIILLTISCGSQLVLGQCDPQLISNAREYDNKVLRYQSRGNRCEGFYGKRVGENDSIWIVGLTYGEFTFQAKNDEIIFLSAPLGSKEVVNIRAKSIPQGVNYQMDGILDVQHKELSWEVSTVLIKNQYTAISSNIGVYGYLITKYREKIYLPLMHSTKSPNSSKLNEPTLILACSARLSSLDWHNEDKKIHGQLDEEIFPNKLIKIKLPSNQKGEFSLVIKGKKKNSGTYITNIFRIKL